MRISAQRSKGDDLVPVKEGSDLGYASVGASASQLSLDCLAETRELDTGFQSSRFAGNCQIAREWVFCSLAGGGTRPGSSSTEPRREVSLLRGSKRRLLMTVKTPRASQRFS